MDDIREQMDLANEISDAIAQPINFGDVIDEDELNAELEGLEQEELDMQLLETDKLSKIPSMPNAPTGPIGKFKLIHYDNHCILINILIIK